MCSIVSLHVTKAQKSNQTMEWDCALWWELFPQPWLVKLLHTRLAFPWALPQQNIHCRSQSQHPCYTAGLWLLMPATELHVWDKAVLQDAPNEYPLTSLSKGKCLLFFSVGRLNRIRWALCEGKIMSFTDFWIESIAVGYSNMTRTWCSVFFLWGVVMLVVHIPPDLEGKPY